MRDKVILATAMPTMTVTVLNEFENLLGDCHALILLVNEYRFRVIFLSHRRVRPETGNNRALNVTKSAICVR
jgi:hypothetical protein